MINRIIKAHDTYIGDPYVICNMAKGYVQARELFDRIMFLPSLISHKTDQKIANLVAYTYGLFTSCLALNQIYENAKLAVLMHHYDYITANISSFIYYLFDGILLIKSFTSKPNLSPVSVSLLGMTQIVGSLAWYKYIKHKYDMAPVSKKHEIALPLKTITCISFGVQGLLLIAKSQMKTSPPLLQNSILIAGIVNSISTYLVELHHKSIQKTP